MSIAPYMPLFLFTAVSTISPGGATTLSAASGAHFGFRRTIPLIIAVSVGLASMAVLASLGLATILMAIPGLQISLKTLGSLYLIWLAYSLAGRGAPCAKGCMGKPVTIIGGLWMQWHNPKGWAMTTGACASFASLANEPAQLAGILGLTFGVAAIISITLWCLVGHSLARLLTHEKQWHYLNIGLAILLVLSIITMWF